MTTETRHGNWLQTRSGIKMYPFDPRADEIAIDDIAWALAHQCRFAGHASKFISVAEHSVRVAQISGMRHAKWGLLHDASEAYLTDIPRPLKIMPEFKFYRDAEAKLQAIICEKFDLSPHEPDVVSRADRIMLATEAVALMGVTEKSGWIMDVDEAMPVFDDDFGWDPFKARAMFMATWCSVSGYSNKGATEYWLSAARNGTGECGKR